MRKILLLILLLVFNGRSQFLSEPVRLSDDKEAWLTGNIDSTLEIIQKMIDSGDNTAINNFNVGYLHFLNGNYNAALKNLQKSLELPDPTPYTYLILARLYDNSGFTSAAYQHIEDAIKIKPENYEFLMELARLTEKSGRVKEATLIYKRVIELYDEKIPPRVALAEIYRKQKKFEEAIEVIEPEDKLYPVEDVLISKSRIFNDMGDKTKAAAFLTEMCEIYPYADKLKTYRDTLQIKDNISISDIKPALPKYNFKFLPDEKINYKVSYGFMTLGWVKVLVDNPVYIRGKKTYPVRFFINSNPDYGMLLSLNHIYESYIDAETLSAVRSRIYTPNEGLYLIKAYEFYYEKNLFLAHMINFDGRFERLEKLLPSSAQDGLSMLYFARGVISNKSGGTTTVVVDEDFKYGHITYLDEMEEIEVNDEDVNTIKIFARADFKGIAGMNGDAWGWFSTDNSLTPLQGKIKILLGSITIFADNEQPEF